MKKCPFCKESIQDSASKCRYCGEFLVESSNKGSSIEPTQGEIKSWIKIYQGYIFLGFIILIFGIINIISSKDIVSIFEATYGGIVVGLEMILGGIGYKFFKERGTSGSNIIKYKEYMIIGVMSIVLLYLFGSRTQQTALFNHGGGIIPLAIFLNNYVINHTFFGKAHRYINYILIFISAVIINYLLIIGLYLIQQI